MKEKQKKKMVCLKWYGRFGLEVYYYYTEDAIKVIEQMQNKYYPIIIKIEEWK